MKKLQLFIILFLLTIFFSCKNGNNKAIEKIIEVENPIPEQKNYSDIGLNYVISTKTQLGKNLIGTIKKKGTVEAMKFCNIRAFPLTDSMANVHSATIKRVSDKTRNSNNKANPLELKNINYFKTKIKNNEEVEPIVIEKKDSIHFYYPILTNTMCLQCHGIPNKQIKPKTLSVLKEFYPNDLATGYTENEVRGIWSIHFKKDNL